MDLHIRDPEAVEAKVQKLIAGGGAGLKVISDFDFTISKFWWDAAGTERACSCYKLIEDCGLLESHYHDRAQALQKKYYPMEVDPNLPRDEKIQAMLDWVTEANLLLRDSGLKRDMLPVMVQGGKLRLRDLTHEVFDVIAAHDIPLLIFSGGVGNVVEEVIQHTGIPITSNTHVISNRMVFGEDGTIQRWTDPHFHAFNKFAKTIADEPFMRENEHRRNVLLFGDSLGDIHMSDGLDMDCILTVGFLNDKVEERLETYKAAYDVVILGDPSLGYHLDLLKKITAAGQ
eukprot:TRINITY_DN35771_c0_g1_i1.p1 TRINITY_DN35771_c0_g1~~TRINITY_DN35771_c0_g1_i1.p1  ORF type:complete len:304 (+),score=132.54 TRINITY_DN35771_c0_g1_i1:53-913(+)